MSNIIIIIAVVAVVGLMGYAVVLNYFESLPPNVQFVSFPTDTITVVEGSTARFDFDIKNFEDYSMSDVLIKTKFNGNVTYATIINSEIVIPELNVNQNTGVKTIKISTHQIEDSSTHLDPDYKKTNPNLRFTLYSSGTHFAPG